MTPEEIDKTGLIRESYRIEGIAAPECRSIFLDWLLKLPQGIAEREAITCLLATYATDAPDHPMTAVLREGLATGGASGRRGGRRGRLGR